MASSASPSYPTRSEDTSGERQGLLSSRSPRCKNAPPSLSGGAFLSSLSDRLLVRVHVLVHVDRRGRILLVHRNHLRRRLRTRRLIFRHVRYRQHDPTMNRIDLEHAHVELHPLVHIVRGIHDRLAKVQLRDRHEALDVVADVDDDALVHQSNHGAADIRVHRIALTDAQPRILDRLLEPQRDPLVLRIDVENDDVHRVTLLHHFRRMLHTLRPAHVGDVDQPIDARLDLDERAEAREVAHLAVDPRADGILVRQHDPRILLRLLHAERDLLLVRIDLEHHRLDHFADRHELRRVTDVARPAHLADVHESFDARLELDERAVVRDRHDLPLDPRAHRILLGDVLPRVALQLLEAERDALALPIDVENLDLELLTDVHQLGRMRDAPPRHVGDVEESIHAAQVDECAEVRDVLDHALPHLILLELLHQLLALARPLDLEDHAARDDDVPPALVALDDLELVLLTQQLVDVRNAAERDLRTRKECVDAHEVDDHATLDLLDERAFHRLIGFVRLTDAFPHAHEVGFLLRKNDRAFCVFEMLEQHLDLVTWLEVGMILELFERNGTLRLEADVEDDHVVPDFQDL